MFLVWLCERTLNVRGFPVREEGKVELQWETPNELSAESFCPPPPRGSILFFKKQKPYETADLVETAGLGKPKAIEVNRPYHWLV
jgi:hypothetical protein